MSDTLTQASHPTRTREAQTLRTLNAFAVDIMSIKNTDDLFWYVAQNVVGKLNFPDCVIYAIDETGTLLTQVAALGEKNPFGRTILNPMRIPVGEGITGSVAKTGEPIIVDDLSLDANYIADTSPAMSEICVPLKSGDRVLGVIDSEHPQARAFGPEEREILVTVAAMTSAKLELLEEASRSARRYRDLVQSHALLTEEIDTRKALEAELFNARRLESLGRLSGGFAHVFNNLLTVIAGNLDLLELEPLPEGARASLVDSRAATERAAKLISNMLAFAQRSRLDPQTVDLRAATESLLADFFDGGEGLAPLVVPNDLWPASADPGVFALALLNLVINARDATPDGRDIRITLSNVPLDFDAARALDLHQGDYLRLDVIDAGPGVAPQALDRIFDPFFTTKPVGQGTGMGLPMVLGFARQSGGTVRVRPGDTEGSVFELYLPRAQDEPGPED